MITASEPLEFIPRGRQAVSEHPGPLLLKKHVPVPADFILLQRMQDVNISLDDSPLEFYLIRETYNELEDNTSGPGFLCEAEFNTEEELYVKGNTAIWTKGLSNDEATPHVCLTCENPIKFAFFSPKSFIASELESKKSQPSQMGVLKDENISAVCLLGGTSLKVYCSNGENFSSTIECPISNVWASSYGILLEKESSSAVLETHCIPMPRLFSLTHPLDEMCPVLIKMSDSTTYLTEAEYRVVFSCEENNLVLMFDEKLGTHFVCCLRKATEEEKSRMGWSDESDSFSNSVFNVTGNISHQHTTPLPKILTPHSFHKTPLLARQNASTACRFSVGAVNSSPYTSNVHLGHTGSFTLNATGVGSSSRNNIQTHATPLSRLQSTLATPISLMDVRKIGQAEPSKPIIPEYCLEHVWTDSKSLWNELPEKASTGFLHTDIVGDEYLCYLLPRSEKLNLLPLNRCETGRLEITPTTHPMQIPAKDAVCLKRLGMIAVLAPCGTLMLYSGPTQVGKVHVAGILTSFVTSSALSNSFSVSHGFPRRSSLLPTVPSQADARFDEELHMLSPVQPLNSAAMSSRLSNCSSIRDGSGNRLTLVFNSEKMFRISLPIMTESQLVSRCILALREILPKPVALDVMIRWYGTKNAPGARDLDGHREWEAFSGMLFQLMGRPYPPPDSRLNKSNSKSSFDEPKKRRKSENCLGADKDWEYLMSHNGTENALDKDTDTEKIAPVPYGPDKSLFKYIPSIFYALHLVYEDLKLQPLLHNALKMLAGFLYELSLDLNLEKFQLHYFLDFHHLVDLRSCCFIQEESRAKFINLFDVNLENVPKIFAYVHKLIAKPNIVELERYPCTERINSRSRDMILIIAYLYRAKGLSKWITEQFEQLFGKWKITPQDDVDKIIANVVIHILRKRRYNRLALEKLPVSIHYLIAQFLEMNRNKPINMYDAEVYELLLRPELYAHATFDMQNNSLHSKKSTGGLKENSLSLHRKTQPEIISKTETKQEENGMENIDTRLLRLRFPDDLRINDVKSYLNSSQPVTIDIVQAPNVSDHEFIEEQEKQLYALCIRTMALPIGRGMFTLRASRPSATQTLPIPKLCLTGKEIHRGATIEIQQLEVPPNMNLWPTFHNGVAAGLRICSDTPGIDSTWITYNKPKGVSDIPTEHAGFLMALGLNGHLKSLSFMSIYEYLVKCDEMISLGLLLGVSAAHRGTMDIKTTKLLSVHIEALLPPTAVELDIAQNIQIASLMGIGLVYQGTAKRHIAEVLLQEIGRPPGPEMENYVERESYALTAGLALGLVTLEQGEKSSVLRDLDIPDTLHYYMVGGNKRPLIGAQKEKYKLPSFQIKEGDTVNIDVTAPGATLALGLMYFRTGNEAIANWMKPPDTTYLLDFIRPDLLLLRIVAKNLIMWHEIDASTDWVYGQIPRALSELIRNRLNTEHQAQPTDHEAQCQAYCNIVCGAAICIGLKYAGTADERAFTTLQFLLKYILGLSGRPFGDFAGKQTLENCTIMILLSVSLVQAGTGDVRVLRAVRMLRSRFGQCHVTYGSHMAIHMALGFLFLGAGRYTLSRSPEAIAALICSIFPKFPIHSNDNRYHLQAFRHLYVLAIEPRLFLPRDIDTGKLCLCEIHYLEKGKSEPVKVMAPCMLPELHTLRKVYVTDPNYWHVYFDQENWQCLEKILKASGCIDLKQRAGCLSYLEDPNRLKSMLTQTLTTNKYNSWKIDAKGLLAFSTDQRISNIATKFLLTANHSSIDELEAIPAEERSVIQMLLLQTYDCVTHDKMHGLTIFMDLMNFIINFNSSCRSSELWQFRIIESIIARRRAIPESDMLISQDMLQSLVDSIRLRLEQMLKDSRHLIRSYVLGVSPERSLPEFLSELCEDGRSRIARLMTFYDLPTRILSNDEIERIGHTDYLQFICGINDRFPDLTTETICIIAEALGMQSAKGTL